MGSGQSSLGYRTAFLELTNKTQPIDVNNDEFWDHFWSDGPTNISDMFASVPGNEIRNLREESPGNLANLCYKAVEKLTLIAEASFPTAEDQQTVINCVRLLTRIMPYIFEDPAWRPFFWSVLPAQSDSNQESDSTVPLAQTLISSLCDLLFCPDFTIHSQTKPGPETAEDMHAIDSCEYIWEAGVGFAQSPPANATHDSNRTEIIRLLLVCFSETMYLNQSEARSTPNKWISFFSGPENRHVLPLFTSLLNVVCSYNPAAWSMLYNYFVPTDPREQLVEVALQVLCVTLEADTAVGGEKAAKSDTSLTASDDAESNLFVNYMSRIHRDEDFHFILEGLIRLLNNPLTQSYLPGSTRKVRMHQELLILFWRICDINRRFLYFVLKSSLVLDVLVPILYHLNEAKQDKSQLGLMHIGVFIILLLSGERNFGVRLNKPYTSRTAFDIAVFTGNHADLLIIVFHKIITKGHQCLQPLYDCLLTIIDNVSPYVKSLSMVSATKLVHLTECFSQPWFLFSAPNNHQLLQFLLEVFNNIIQYQFDGNSCLVYSLLRKRQIFYALANLPSTDEEIYAVLAKHGGPEFQRRFEAPPDTDDEEEEEEGADNVREDSEAGLGHPKAPEEFLSPKAAEKVQPGAGTPTSSSKVEKEVEKDSTPEEKSQSHAAASLQTSLAGTPSLASMTTDAGPVGDAEADMAISAVSGSEEEANGAQGCGKDTAAAAPASVPAVGTPKSTHLEATFGADVTSKSPNSSRQTNPETPAKQERSKTTSTTASSTKRRSTNGGATWRPTAQWVAAWREKMPLQTIMRMLQVLVPQVEKICIEKSLKDEPQILKFLQNGTLVGLLPVPHAILIRKYQSNEGTAEWFRTYIWGVIYLRNTDPAIWFDTDVRLFEVQQS